MRWFWFAVDCIALVLFAALAAGAILAVNSVVKVLFFAD